MQNDTPIPAELLAIAEHLGFPTLETRSSDSLDFREVAVWMVRDALRHAYEAGRPVRRTITEHHRKVMRETGDLDPTFSVVEKARLTPFKRDKTRYLLWDVVDMTLAQLWEIKPIGSAAQGVIQETYYRLAYEFFAIHWICFGFLPTERLESGDQDYPLIDPFTGQLLVYTRFSTVLPFTCSLLPGLVLYGVMKKRHEELERVLSRIRAFVRAVQEIVRKVIAVVKAILVIALVCAVVLLVLVLLILIILLSALQPSPSPVPGLPPGGEGRDPVPVPDRERVPASLGAMRVVAGSSGVTLALEARPPRGQAAVLHFGTITVDALDVARVGPFVERLTGVLDEALEAMSTAGRGLSSGTAPNV